MLHASMHIQAKRDDSGCCRSGGCAGRVVVEFWLGKQFEGCVVFKQDLGTFSRWRQSKHKMAKSVGIENAKALIAKDKYIHLREEY